MLLSVNRNGNQIVEQVYQSQLNRLRTRRGNGSGLQTIQYPGAQIWRTLLECGDEVGQESRRVIVVLVEGKLGDAAIGAGEPLAEERDRAVPASAEMGVSLCCQAPPRSNSSRRASRRGRATNEVRGKGIRSLASSRLFFMRVQRQLPKKVHV